MRGMLRKGQRHPEKGTLKLRAEGCGSPQRSKARIFPGSRGSVGRGNLGKSWASQEVRVSGVMNKNDRGKRQGRSACWVMETLGTDLDITQHSLERTESDEMSSKGELVERRIREFGTFFLWKLWHPSLCHPWVQLDSPELHRSVSQLAL